MKVPNHALLAANTAITGSQTTSTAVTTSLRGDQHNTLDWFRIMEENAVRNLQMETTLEGIMVFDKSATKKKKKKDDSVDDDEDSDDDDTNVPKSKDDGSDKQNDDDDDNLEDMQECCGC